LEIFNCEINPLLEKFFEAPEPKVSAAAAEKEDLGDDEVLTDKLSDKESGASGSKKSVVSKMTGSNDEEEGSKHAKLERKNTPMPGTGTEGL